MNGFGVFEFFFKENLLYVSLLAWNSDHVGFKVATALLL